MILEKLENSFYFIRLNRPEIRNAFNPEMIKKLINAFGNVQKEKHVRAVIIEGEGAAFCSGADLGWMQSLINSSVDENKNDALLLHELFSTIWNCDVPVISCVQGAAYGGALGLMAVSDYVICDKKTQLCFSEVKLGIAPAVISEFLYKKCNISFVRNWMISGMPFDSEQAYLAGLVHKVVSSSEMQDEKMKYLNYILESAPVAVRSIKKILREIPEMNNQDVKNRTTSLIAALRTGTEGQEGLKSFIEKRQPSWRKS